MITTRRQQFLPLKIHNSKWAYARLMPFQCRHLISSRRIINDQTTIFATNSNLIFFNLNSTQNNICKFNSFKITLIWKIHLFTPFYSRNLLWIIYISGLFIVVCEILPLRIWLSLSLWIWLSLSLRIWLSLPLRIWLSPGHISHRLLFINSIKKGPLILINKIIRIPNELKLFLISIPQIISKIFF